MRTINADKLIKALTTRQKHFVKSSDNYLLLNTIIGSIEDSLLIVPSEPPVYYKETTPYSYQYYKSPNDPDWLESTL